jgi:hypothetical protein
MTPHDRAVFASGFLVAFALAAHIQGGALGQVDARLRELERGIGKLESRPRRIRIRGRLVPAFRRRKW